VAKPFLGTAGCQNGALKNTTESQMWVLEMEDPFHNMLCSSSKGNPMILGYSICAWAETCHVRHGQDMVYIILYAYGLIIMVILPLSGTQKTTGILWYIKPHYWIDDHPLSMGFIIQLLTMVLKSL